MRDNGGGGVKNCLKFRDVIYGRSVSYDMKHLRIDSKSRFRFTTPTMAPRSVFVVDKMKQKLIFLGECKKRGRERGAT